MIPDDMIRAIPPEPHKNRKGKQPSLLTNEKVAFIT